jgi:hypothetical protein
MVYLIMGLPGTGKTYFAKALSARLSAAHANTDSIRAEQDLMGRYDPDTKEKVYELLLERMLEKARKGEDVVIDATFIRRSIRDGFIEPLEVEGIPFRLIRMDADRSIVKERVSKDRPDSEAGIEVYDELKNKLDPVERDHVILDSGTMDLESMLRSVGIGTESSEQ